MIRHVNYITLLNYENMFQNKLISRLCPWSDSLHFAERENVDRLYNNNKRNNRNSNSSNNNISRLNASIWPRDGLIRWPLEQVKTKSSKVQMINKVEKVLLIQKIYFQF